MPEYLNDFTKDTILVSYPQWLHMIDMSIAETAPQWLWINVNDPDDHATIDKIYNAFKEEFGASSNIELNKAYEDREKTD